MHTGTHQTSPFRHQVHPPPHVAKEEGLQRRVVGKELMDCKGALPSSLIHHLPVAKHSEHHCTYTHNRVALCKEQYIKIVGRGSP